MAAKKEVASSEPVVLPVDSGASVYRDKSGSALGGGPSEGKSNFGAITAEAIKSVEDAKANDQKPAA